MLELRPSCENCHKSLPPNSTDAYICSYECTFCFHCMSSLLINACPNCGGGFCPRPIRPSRNWNDNNSLAFHPGAHKVTFRPVDKSAHAELLEKLGNTPPELR